MDKSPMLLSAALLVILTVDAMARIGSTAIEVWRKYGDPIEEIQVGKDTIRTFLVQGFEVRIFFNGSHPHPKQTAFRVCYKKIPSEWSPKDSRWRGAHIPVEQMQQLLRENGGKRKWIGTPAEGFKSEDSKLLASFDPSSNELVVETL